MVLPPVVDQPILETLIGAIHRTAWSWDRAGFRDLARQLGWIELVDDEDGGIYDLPWPSRGRDVSVTYHPDRGINDFDITRANVVGLKVPAAFLPGVFTLADRAVTAVLGESTDNTPGATPEVRWAGPQRTVLISQLDIAVTLTWADNGWQKIADYANDHYQD